MPWRQLTRCTLVGDYNAVECYDIIKDCPNLSYCELAVTGISDSVEDDIDLQPSIAHPNIDVLKIRNEETLLRLLERLELPVLTEFAHTSPSPVLSLYTHTASLFLRSAPPLRRLELDNMAHARDSDLIDCLEQCPSLQELSLTSNSASGVSEWFLHRLTHFPELEQCCLVPKLQSFTVSVSWDFVFEAFTEMIKSRWGRHGLECRAVDHKAVEQIRKATLHRMSNSQAVDAVDRRDESPRWFYDLRNFQAEGFSLTSTNDSGVLIPLEDVVLSLDYADPDSDGSDSDDSEGDDSDSDDSEDDDSDSDEMDGEEPGSDESESE